MGKWGACARFGGSGGDGRVLIGGASPVLGEAHAHQLLHDGFHLDQLFLALLPVFVHLEALQIVGVADGGVRLRCRVAVQSPHGNHERQGQDGSLGAGQSGRGGQPPARSQHSPVLRRPAAPSRARPRRPACCYPPCSVHRCCHSGTAGMEPPATRRGGTGGMRPSRRPLHRTVLQRGTAAHTRPQCTGQTRRRTGRAWGTAAHTRRRCTRWRPGMRGMWGSRRRWHGVLPRRGAVSGGGAHEFAAFADRPRRCSMAKCAAAGRSVGTMCPAPSTLMKLSGLPGISGWVDAARGQLPHAPRLLHLSHVRAGDAVAFLQARPSAARRRPGAGAGRPAQTARSQTPSGPSTAAPLPWSARRGSRTPDPSSRSRR